MPSSPEFRDVLGEEWIIKIPGDVETKQARESQRHVGIPGEIRVDLDAVEKCSQEQGAGGQLPVVAKNLVYEAAAVVGDDDLLEQSPGNLTHTITGLVVVEYSL